MRRRLFITWVVLLVAQACVLAPDIAAAQGAEAVKACEQICYAESKACVKALCLPGGALRPPYDKGPDGTKRYGTCYSGCKYAHSVSSNPCESLCVRMMDVPRCMNPVPQTALSCWRECRGAWTEYGACDKRCRQVAAGALATCRQSTAGAAPKKKPVKPDIAVSGRMAKSTSWTTPDEGFPASAEVEILIEASPPLPGYVVIDEAPFATFQPRAGRLDQQGRFTFRFTAPQDPDEYVIRYGINFGDEVGYHDDNISVQIAEPKIVLIGGNVKWHPIEGKGDPAARSHRYNLDLRSAEALFLYGSRSRQLADDLLSYSWGRAILKAYAEDDVQQLLRGGGWQPGLDPHAQAAKYGKLFADYWKWGVDFNVKFTGNILAEWPISETVEQTFEITGDVMKYTGVDVSTFKVGDILDKVGLAAAGVELLLGLHDAVTYQEQEDAINKFGFALVDGTLGNILADVAGGSAGLATWYVNFLLSETRDALMAKHETAWIDAFAQWAIERDWVGRLSDKAALAKVVRTLKSGKNLETTILQEVKS